MVGKARVVASKGPRRSIFSRKSVKQHENYILPLLVFWTSNHGCALKVVKVKKKKRKDLSGLGVTYILPLFLFSWPAPAALPFPNSQLVEVSLHFWARGWVLRSTHHAPSHQPASVRSTNHIPWTLDDTTLTRLLVLDGPHNQAIA